MDRSTKQFYWDIPDLTLFIKNERIKNNNRKDLNSDDFVIVYEIKNLCYEAKNIINRISESEFKQSIISLIELDSKISSYLFFLIYSDFLDYSKIHEIVKKDAVSDYYMGLSYNDSLNNYKFIFIY